MITGKIILISIYVIIWLVFIVFRKHYKTNSFLSTYKLWLITWVMIHGIVAAMLIIDFLIKNFNTPLI